MTLHEHELNALDLMGTYDRYAFWWPIEHRNLDRILSNLYTNARIRNNAEAHPIKPTEEVFQVKAVNNIVRPRVLTQDRWIAAPEMLRTLVIVPNGYHSIATSPFDYVTASTFAQMPLNDLLAYKRLIVTAPLNQHIVTVAHHMKEVYVFGNAPDFADVDAMYLWYSLFNPISLGDFKSRYYRYDKYPVATQAKWQTEVGLNPAMDANTQRDLTATLYERVWHMDRQPCFDPWIFRTDCKLTDILKEIGPGYLINIYCNDANKILDTQDACEHAGIRLGYLHFSWPNGPKLLTDHYLIKPGRMKDTLMSNSTIPTIFTDNVDYAN
jgi:hypothetical protein